MEVKKLKNEVTEIEKSYWMNSNSKVEMTCQSRLCDWHTDQWNTDQWNKIEILPRDSHKCAQLIFDTGTKVIQWRKDSFLNT